MEVRINILCSSVERRKTPFTNLWQAKGHIIKFHFRILQWLIFVCGSIRTVFWILSISTYWFQNVRVVLHITCSRFSILCTELENLEPTDYIKFINKCRQQSIHQIKHKIPVPTQTVANPPMTSQYTMD